MSRRECRWTVIREMRTLEQSTQSVSSKNDNQAFAERQAALAAAKQQVFNRAQVDRVPITTAADYVVPLAAFFQRRVRRLTR